MNDDARFAAWDAIAELFLDTEPTPRDREWMAERLAALPFTLDELDAIYADEVAPALCWNLRVVAGQWGMWDATWLRERVTRFAARRRPGTGFATSISRRLNTFETAADWRALRARVAELRG